MTNIPAGWYPDPENASAQRWWDGRQWAAATPQADPYRMDAGLQLRSPAGTSTNTVWIWLIIFLPFLPYLAMLTIDWGRFILAAVEQPQNPLAPYGAMGPGYLIAMVGGWVVYGLCVFFAYRDFATLRSRGVPRPFHWAWTFLSSIVYLFGRGVVTKRRGGPGNGMIWAGVLSIVGIVLFLVVLMVVMISQMMAVIPAMPRY